MTGGLVTRSFNGGLKMKDRIMGMILSDLLKGECSCDNCKRKREEKIKEIKNNKYEIMFIDNKVMCYRSPDMTCDIIVRNKLNYSEHEEVVLKEIAHDLNLNIDTENKEQFFKLIENFN